MIDDPYKTLGISQNATEDEIKKAYRKKAKEYHPDLHPNDPVAMKKMQEVNKAYDMLMNPEKYANQRAQQQRQQSSHQYNPYNRNSSQSSGGYQGPGGWASDFGFDFEDFFGFGSSYQTASTKPQNEPGDSPRIRQVVSYINNGSYQQALELLFHTPSYERNARWYYLSSLANHGAGNSVQAVDHMQKACEMEPNNKTYQQLLRQFRQAERTYESNASGFNMNGFPLDKICLGLCAARMCCGFRCI